MALASISVKVEQRELDALLRELGEWPAEIPKASARAVNKTLGKVQTLVIGETAAVSGLKAKGVRKRMSILKAFVKGSKVRLDASIRFYPQKIGLINKKGQRPPQSGNFYVGGKARTPTPIRHKSFRQTMKSGHVGYMVRTERQRQPIKELFTEGVIDALEKNPQVIANAAKLAAEDLPKQVMSQIDYVISKKRPA